MLLLNEELARARMRELEAEAARARLAIRVRAARKWERRAESAVPPPRFPDPAAPEPSAPARGGRLRRLLGRVAGRPQRANPGCQRSTIRR